MAQILPSYRGQLKYICQVCGRVYDSDELLYTCPECKGVFLLEDKKFDHLKKISGEKWREIFDTRAATKTYALRGIFRYYELIAPILDEEDIVYLGEGNTPIVFASSYFQKQIGIKFAFKNEGQNPSASFKDRGMACAFSYLKHLVRKKGYKDILAICASTGDTSASAAMYGAYVGEPIKSVVLLPKGKVTPQQLAQPLGSGAIVLELPGVFDDCMKVVEYLADNYNVALLNSKNSWRILGQESYSFEIAQWFDWDVSGKVVFVPIGNAGNIAAIISGFLKLYELKIINSLPRIIGVQSTHADPVYRYYSMDKNERKYSPVPVRPSVAQAAMIGNPVSFPRVKKLVEKFESIAGEGCFNVVEVKEQEIIEGMLLANQKGHIACTQGGECLAGLIKAKEMGVVEKDEIAILNATAHSLKFLKFQQMYFEDSYPEEYEITPRDEYKNFPKLIISEEYKKSLENRQFYQKAAENIVSMLGIEKKNND